MDIAIVVSAVAFGVSVIVSAIKFIDWFVNSDPRALVRTGRHLLFFLAIASVPCLILLLIYQQWALAMMLGAGMLIVPTFLNWRTLFARVRFQPAWQEGGPASPIVEPNAEAMRGDYGQPPPDAELARRAAVVLEDYLRHAQRLETDAGRGDRRRPAQRKARGAPMGVPMGVEEAHDVLGLEPGASAEAVRAAHRRLVQMVHPDRGGSNYLAAKINEAKEILLAQSVRRPSTSARGRARVTRKQAAPVDQPNAAGGPET